MDVGPTWTPANARNARMLDGIDVRQLAGVEIGALAAPIVTPGEGRIRYVDHLNTASLRRKYAAHGAVDVSALVEVDAVWGEASLSAALGPGCAVDYVLASHVIEHVPDLLGWLGEVAGIMRPGAALRLAIPDRRFTFDYFRQESRLADLLNASLLRARVPLPAQILDHMLEAVSFDPAATDGWSNPDEVARLHILESAVGPAMDSHRNGVYHDVHCWVFTPATFASRLGRACRLGLHRFACDWVEPTPPGHNEFLAALVLSDDPVAAAASWREPANRLRTDEDDSAHLVARLTAERDVAVALAAATQTEADGTAARIAAIERTAAWRVAERFRTLLGALRPRG